jgi:hypothetical protein
MKDVGRKLKEKYHLGELTVDGMIILTRILTGFIWLRIWFSGWLL